MRIALKLALLLILGIVLVLALHIAFPSDNLDELGPTAMAALRFDQLRLAGTMLVVTGLIALGVCVTRIGRPINALRDQVRAVANGSIWGPVQLDELDEIADLGSEINRMCREMELARQKIADEATAREDALENLRHVERLAAVGKVASIVAHELGTPLNVISARAAMIADGEASPEETAESARVIVEQSQRMSRIIREVLGMVRKGPPERSDFVLNDLVKQSVDLLSRSAAKHHVVIDVVDEGAPKTLHLDASRITQVLTNLITNGIQAMPKGGSLTVKTGLVSANPKERRAPDGYATIAVCDSGEGISEEQLKLIFKPFFSTKGEKSGTGLGLAVCEGIAREHSGWIDVNSEVGKGSCFKLCLPMGGGA